MDPFLANENILREKNPLFERFREVNAKPMVSVTRNALAFTHFKVKGGAVAVSRQVLNGLLVLCSPVDTIFQSQGALCRGRVTEHCARKNAHSSLQG